MSDLFNAPSAKTKKSYFRASLIYEGKHAGKTGCAFVKALTKEDAHSFILSSLKKSGYGEQVKIEITPASKGEVDFYMMNRTVQGYTGIVN
jgi:ribosomal protein L21E